MKTQRLVVAAGALVVLLFEARPLHALGPTVMMFYGGTLRAPIYVTGADTEVFGDVRRRSTTTVKDLGERPYLSVALFWGPAANPALNGVRVLTGLTPEMAWQHGRFYPSTATQPAVFLATPLTKSTDPAPIPRDGSAFTCGGPLPASAARVLERLGLQPGGQVLN